MPAPTINESVVSGVRKFPECVELKRWNADRLRSA